MHYVLVWWFKEKIQPKARGFCGLVVYADDFVVCFQYKVFRYQIKGRIVEGDILFGISGSGNSINVINAMEHVKPVGAKTIALVGFNGGKMKRVADYCIHVNINDMQISEDVHMIMDHLMMSVLSHGQGC